jgi:cell wall-associated NlpC family hydrolase
MQSKWIGCLTLTVAAAFAQQATKPSPEPSSARELYYFAVTSKDPLPPIQKTATPAKKANPAPAGRQAKSEAQPPEKTSGNAAAPATAAVVIPVSAPTPAPAAAMHLGFRYSVALVDTATGKSEAVDASRVFHKGECFAIDIESNRSGYLYVLAKQSSGNWAPLFPAPQMGEADNVIDPGQKMRFPKGYCFEVNDPPGTETLFVVLSRDPRDVYDLHEGIKGGPNSNEASPSSPRPKSDSVQLADARLVNTEVDRMSKQLGSRDINIKKATAEPGKQDPEHSVYVVNASDKPSATVMTQIQVRHL